MNRVVQLAMILAGMLCGTRVAPAQPFVWSGGGADNNWSTPANWAGGSAPTTNGSATVILAGTTRLTPHVDGPWEIHSLVFSNNAGAFTLGGQALTLRGGGIVNSNANPQTINNAITLRSNQTWNAAAGSLSAASRCVWRARASPPAARCATSAAAIIGGG